MTRKSSCVNARGIPTAAYQVLHLFPEVGYPSGRGIPPARSDGGGGGVREVGYPPSMGYPPVRSDQGGTQGGVLPRQGVPPQAGPGPGRGTPPRCGQTDGWMDGQTRVKTLPSRRTTYAVGKNIITKRKKFSISFLSSQSAKGRYQNLFNKPSVKLVRIDVIEKFWRASTRELNLITWIEYVCSKEITLWIM